MKLKKIVLMATSMALVAALAVGGTLAYLTSKTDVITNTFTVGKVAITLTETWNTDSNGDNVNDSWSAQLMPGHTYTKDPTVTVSSDSEKCYLFVKVTETNNPGTYLSYSYTMAAADSGWTKWTDATGIGDNDAVYYRVVEKSENDQSWSLLTGNKVTVRDTVGGKVSMPAANSTPSIAFQAYAIQFDGFTATSDKSAVVVAWEALCNAISASGGDETE